MRAIAAHGEAPYDSAFYNNILTSSQPSADVVVPLLLKLARPCSVIDVGCGTGSWLATFRRLGVDTVLGIDGPWVEPKTLEIPIDCFRAMDLTGPVSVARKFDLVMSLETAEHLPPDCAARFVRSLTGLGDLVAFSAAIPHQGGTSHVNEQWPDYWGRLFADNGFIAIDCLRSRLWNNPQVAWWYSQNLLLFAESGRFTRDETLRKAAEKAPTELLPLVHPRKYLETISEFTASASAGSISVGSAVRQVAKALQRRVRQLGAAKSKREPA